MAIKIGHASKDENGKIAGGVSGDQTGKEVCTRTWYNYNWNYVLRCKNSSKAELIASACEKACLNNKIGYDQNQRTTLYTQACKVNHDLSKITTPCECDCSSLACECAIASGISVAYNLTTSTMKAGFSKTGMFDVLTESKYLTTDTYLKRGDILVRPGYHTVIVLETGVNAISPSNKDSAYTVFVKGVQKACGAKVDGIAGTETLSKTITISKSKNSKHAVVAILQEYFNSLGHYCGIVDGVAGNLFDIAVKSYQRANGCFVDGEITAKATTWKRLLKLT
ncbi:peptidoglycan-binding protein [Lachnospiraceae bacterium OttesenSCG-928-D06]|nr:peptidoglycan-binding protein [Lachnospiraceae bacterium OttesenSCG-928-D06]